MPHSNNNLIKTFIEAHRNDDPALLALNLKDFNGAEKSFLLTQLSIYKKAIRKLPTFCAAWCTFTDKSYEQSSSESLALYKASLVPKGLTMLDICGGLGVDDWAFSKRFNKVVSLDIDAELNRIAKDNFTKLGILNIERRDADAEVFLHKKNTYDFLYADSDRRPQGKRVPALEDARPDLLNLKSRMLEISPLVMIKLSPMLDISEIIRRLLNVHEVHVVSTHNEVKELLVMMKREVAEKITIRAVEINTGGTNEFKGTFGEKVVPAYGDNGGYFYEPAAALIKAGLSQAYASMHQLSMISANTYYFVSDEHIRDFFGRSFKVLGRIDFSKANVRSYLDKNEIYQANISRRNFPMEAEELKNLFTIEDGGDEYLFFTQNGSGRKLVYHCVKCG